jgi:hypothetical protein
MIEAWLIRSVRLYRLTSLPVTWGETSKNPPTEAVVVVTDG